MIGMTVGAALAATLLWAAVPPAPCNCESSEGRPAVPPGTHLEDHPRTGLLISGGIVVAVAYVVPLVATASKSKGQSYYYLASNEVPFDPSPLFVPVIGPWVALASMKSYDNCSVLPERGTDPSICTHAQSSADKWTAFLIVDGVVQLSGAALMIAGVIWPRHQLVINSDKVKAQVVPAQLGSFGQGLAVVGTFDGL
jgi:hypothetical protein